MNFYQVLSNNNYFIIENSILLVPGINSNHQYEKGMQIIKAVVIAGDLNKVKMMCGLWSADKRIVLRKIDKDNLLQTLDRSGELSKKQYVTALSEMVSYIRSFSICFFFQ